MLPADIVRRAAILSSLIVHSGTSLVAGSLFLSGREMMLRCLIQFRMLYDGWVLHLPTDKRELMITASGDLLSGCRPHHTDLCALEALFPARSNRGTRPISAMLIAR